MPSKWTLIAYISLLVIFVGAVYSETVGPAPRVAVWNFAAVGVSEADAREYVDGLINHLKRKEAFTVIDAGGRILDHIPELVMRGRLKNVEESYGVAIHLQNMDSKEILVNLIEDYPSRAALFADSGRLAEDIAFKYRITEDGHGHSFFFCGYAFDGEIYNGRDLVERIAVQPNISEELQGAIAAYRSNERRSFRRSMIFMVVGLSSLGFGGLALIIPYSAESTLDSESRRRFLAVTASIAVVGTCVGWWGYFHFKDPPPKKVVEIYNRGVGD
jgi:hypothetical protein